MKERVIPRQHYRIFSKEGEELGNVTSGILSPSLNIGIAMGYVRSDYTKVGTNLFVEIRNSRYEAEVVKPPFYKQATHR